MKILDIADQPGGVINFAPPSKLLAWSLHPSHTALLTLKHPLNIIVSGILFLRRQAKGWGPDDRGMLSRGPAIEKAIGGMNKLVLRGPIGVPAANLASGQQHTHQREREMREMVTPMRSRKNKLSVGCKTPAAANGPGRQQLAASAQMMVVMLSWPSFPQHALAHPAADEREKERSTPRPTQ